MGASGSAEAAIGRSEVLGAAGDGCQRKQTVNVDKHHSDCG